MAINEPLCEGMRSFLKVNGTAAAEQAGDLVSFLLLPPFPDPEPKPLKVLLDWEDYPPVGVLQALMQERFSVFSARMLEIVNVTDFHTKLIEQDDVRLTLSKVQIQGVAGEKRLAWCGHQSPRVQLGCGCGPCRHDV